MNQDWSQYDELDWENPNCNTTNITAENYYYFECSEFGFYDYYSYCYIYYTVESCDISNFTCNIWYNDYNYNYVQHDCGDDLRNETYWTSQQNNSIWFDANRPELFYVWEHWNDYHYGVGEFDDYTEDLGDWFGDFFDSTSDYELHANPACMDPPTGEDMIVSAECKHFDPTSETDFCFTYF
jgi:hypothetical protein